MLSTSIADDSHFIKHLLWAGGWGHSSEHGRGAVWRLLGGGDIESRPQRLSSLDPCPGRCPPAPRPRHPRRPRALGAQDQAADPETEAQSPEDALPAAWGPQAALRPQPAPRPGAAAGRLRPGRPRQEGQDEEEDVEMTQPCAPCFGQARTSADVPCVPLVPVPLLGVRELPAGTLVHEEECCTGHRGSSCLCLSHGRLIRVLKGA